MALEIPKIALFQEIPKNEEFLHVGIIIAYIMKQKGYKLSVYVASVDTNLSRILEIVLDQPVYNLDLHLQKSEHAVKKLFMDTIGSSKIALILGYIGGPSSDEAFPINTDALKVAEALKCEVIPIINGETSAGFTVRICEEIFKEIDANFNDIKIEGVLFTSVPSLSEYQVLDTYLGRRLPWITLGYIPKHILLKSIDPSTLATPTGIRTFLMKTRATAGTLLHHSDYIDIPVIAALALKSQKIESTTEIESFLPMPLLERVPVAIFSSAPFRFGYRENEFLLRYLGADLLPIDPITDDLPTNTAAVYIPHGYPHVLGMNITNNKKLWSNITQRIATGMPVWVEGGSVGIVGREIQVSKSTKIPMLNILPITASLSQKGKIIKIEAEATRNTNLLLAHHKLRGIYPDYLKVEPYDTVAQELVIISTEDNKKWDEGWTKNSLLASYGQYNLWSNPESAKTFLLTANRWKSGM